MSCEYFREWRKFKFFFFWVVWFGGKVVFFGVRFFVFIFSVFSIVLWIIDKIIIVIRLKLVIVDYFS